MNPFSANEVVEMAVQIEKSGYAYYNEALNMKGLSEDGKKLLTTLRDAEKKHEIYFSGLRDSVDMSELEESPEWDVVASYLNSIIDSRIFSDTESAIKLATSSKTEKEVCYNAMNFEKDTLLYFVTIRDNLKTQKSKELIQKIVAEEITHIMFLDEYKKTNQL